MLHYDAIRTDTLDTLRAIQRQPELSATRLVGGTALALQLGHRLSVDIDLFGFWDKSMDLCAALGRCGHAVAEQRTENIWVFNVNDVKVDVVFYEYAWLADPVQVDGLVLASPCDIAPMKLEAVTNRGSKKDFIDLAFLLETYSLSEMLKGYAAKYPHGSEFLVLRSLTYFDDAEDDPMPGMLKPMAWDTVKERIQCSVREVALS
jgi:hypothetical protein